jgi:hypothetical protein
MILVFRGVCLAALVAFASATVAQTPQVDPVRAAMKTADGALFIWNQPGNNFTLEIKGQDVRPNNNSPDVYFKADGIEIQIQSAAIAQFIVGSESRPEERAVLALHKNWETQYVEKTLGHITITESTEVKLNTGRSALLWKFDLPEKFRNHGRETIFLTTLNGDYVIVLAANVKVGQDEGHVRQFLSDTMATMKVSDKAFALPPRP